MPSIEEFDKLCDKIERLKTDKSREEGKIESLKKRLEEFNCNNIQDAEIKIKEMNDYKTETLQKINDNIARIKELMP